MDTVLQEQDRQKLDGIVQQMIANKESDSTINMVVSDFKQKYGQSSNQNQQPSLIQSLAQGIVNPLVRPIVSVGNLAEQAVSTVGTEIGQGNSPYIKNLDTQIANEQKGGYDLGYFGKVRPYGSSGSLSDLKDTLGNALQIGATIAPAAGVASTGLGRIAQFAGTGALTGGGTALTENKSAGEVLKQTAIGGAVGAGTGALTEGISQLVNKLPTWLTKSTLPKLKDENVPYALENLKLGSVNSMVEKSQSSVQNYENQVQTILAHPVYKETVGGSTSILNDAVKQFPNSEYTVEDILNNARNLVPETGKLLTKFENGTADVQEINTIRKALDRATKSVYTTLNRPPESKALGAALAGSMRDFVQNVAPETQPIFANYSKELDLRKVLMALEKKTGHTVTLKDLVAGGTGFMHGGFQGGIKAILLERGLLSPAGRIGAAKAINSLGGGNIVRPVVQTLSNQAVKGISQ